MDENRSRGSPRLQFSKEELENDALSRPIQKAEKAADKYEAAQKKLKRYRVRLTLENRESETASSTDAWPGSIHLFYHLGGHRIGGWTVRCSLCHRVCHRLLAEWHRLYGARAAGQPDWTSGVCELSSEQNGSHPWIL